MAGNYAELMCTAPAIESQHPSIFMADTSLCPEYDGFSRELIDCCKSQAIPPKKVSENSRKCLKDSQEACSDLISTASNSSGIGVSFSSADTSRELLLETEDPLESRYEILQRCLGHGGQGFADLLEKKTSPLMPRERSRNLLGQTVDPARFISKRPAHHYYNHESLPKYIVIKEISFGGDEAAELTTKYFHRAVNISTLILRHSGHRAILDVFYDRKYPTAYRSIALFANANDLHELVQSYYSCEPAKFLPEPFIWHVYAELASALRFLYDLKPRPICHRDIKPGNVVLHRDASQLAKLHSGGYIFPSVKLIDFDLAREYDPSDCIFQGGTTAFQPPEQLDLSQPPEATPQGDVYALGATILFMATGHAPRTEHARCCGGGWESDGSRRGAWFPDPATLRHLVENYGDSLDFWIRAALDGDPRVRVTAAGLCGAMVPLAAEPALRVWEELPVEERRLPVEPEIWREWEVGGKEGLSDGGKNAAGGEPRVGELDVLIKPLDGVVRNLQEVPWGESSADGSGVAQREDAYEDEGEHWEEGEVRREGACKGEHAHEDKGTTDEGNFGSEDEGDLGR